MALSRLFEELEERRRLASLLRVDPRDNDAFAGLTVNEDCSLGGRERERNDRQVLFPIHHDQGRG